MSFSASSPTPFQEGDRVRIKDPLSEYTGCRGTIVVDAADQPQGVLALGHFVAIDGENGRTRPFLVGDLERLRVRRVAGAAQDATGTSAHISANTSIAAGSRIKASQTSLARPTPPKRRD